MMISHKYKFGLIAAAALGLALSDIGCERADPVKPETLVPTLQSIQTNIFNQSCAVSNCHLGSSAPLGLDLSEGNAEQNLLNVPSQQVPSFMRIRPGDPDNSYLVLKLEGDSRIQGERMPRGQAALPREQIDVIKEWVANLAVGNDPVVGDIPNQVIDKGQNFADITLDDYVEDPNNPDDEITWSVTGGGIHLSASVSADRMATITILDSTWSGSETLTFTATDPGGLSDSDSAVFSVKEATFSFIQSNVFSTNCAFSGCHLGPNAPEGLELDSANAYGNLVNVASGQIPSFLRVNPGNPDSSYLVLKVEGDPVIQGQRMPRGGAPLSPTLIAAIREWIAAGAQNN